MELNPTAHRSDVSEPTLPAASEPCSDQLRSLLDRAGLAECLERSGNRGQLEECPQVSADRLVRIFSDTYSEFGADAAETFAALVRQFDVFHPVQVTQLLIELESQGWIGNGIDLTDYRGAQSFRKQTAALAFADVIRGQFLQRALGEELEAPIQAAAPVPPMQQAPEPPANKVDSSVFRVRTDKIGSNVVFEIHSLSRGHPVRPLLSDFASVAKAVSLTIRREASKLLSDPECAPRLKAQLQDLPVQVSGRVSSTEIGSMMQLTDALGDYSYVVVPYRGVGDDVAIYIRFGADRVAGKKVRRQMAKALQGALINYYK